jgi:hypothetical protein
MRRITRLTTAAGGITRVATPIWCDQRSFNQLVANEGARDRSLPIPAYYA